MSLAIGVEVIVSRLAWARELKCHETVDFDQFVPSRLAWARELKCIPLW